MNKTVQEIQTAQAEKAANNTMVFHKALLGLHGDIDALKKDKKNPFFNSSYVPLPVMLRILKPILSKHGFILNQGVDVGTHPTLGTQNIASSRIIHVNTGLSQESRIALPPTTDIHKLCGAITYLRRYTLSGVLSLEEVDDDGNTAVGNRVAKGGVKVKDKF